MRLQIAISVRQLFTHPEERVHIQIFCLIRSKLNLQKRHETVKADFMPAFTVVTDSIILV